MEASADQQALSPEERKQLLAQQVQRLVAKGYRIEFQADYNATLVKGRRPNHLLHLILTILTLGFWAIVWIILAVKGETRRSVTVDEYGRLH